MKVAVNSQQVVTLLPVLIVIIAAVYFYRLNANAQSNVKLPEINGFILKAAQPLINIQLADHQGEPVQSDYFLGKWHFISYGYTQCPDICPTTLFTLTQVVDLISTDNNNPDTQVVFYSVDPYRDSQEILAQYIRYFSENFSAIRANTAVAAKKFQQSLGIKVEINSGSIHAKNVINEQPFKALKNEQSYQVNHGLSILLINPDAQLQAVFLPEITKWGMEEFTSEILYRDYLAVINYYQQARFVFQAKDKPTLKSSL